MEWSVVSVAVFAVVITLVYRWNCGSGTQSSRTKDVNSNHNSNSSGSSGSSGSSSDDVSSHSLLVKSSVGGGADCACFMTSHIYIKQIGNKTINKHFDFDPANEKMFDVDYGDWLERKKLSADERKLLISSLRSTVQRRRDSATDSNKRREVIASTYRPLHADVYHLNFATDIHPTLQQLLCVPSREQLHAHQSLAHVYTFPVFTSSFCDRLLEELSNYEASDCPKCPPNSMNRFGIRFDEVGFTPHFTNILLQEVIRPLASLLLPEWGGVTLDTHHAFSVKYDATVDDGDLDLSAHFDNAEITLNVNLGVLPFKGGNLEFYGLRPGLEQADVSRDYNVALPAPSLREGGIVTHEVGVGVLHRGRHFHRAQTLESGVRVNLIVWCRSSAFRATYGCPMCDRTDQFLPD